MSVESELQTILTSGQVPSDLVITYDDMHRLWGGTAIIIRGNGSGERRERARGDAKPKVFEAIIAQSQLLELIRFLVSLEAWEQQAQDRQAAPDESRATVTIRVRGQTSSVWEWYNEMEKNKRLIRIKTKMMEMTRSHQ